VVGPAALQGGGVAQVGEPEVGDVLYGVGGRVGVGHVELDGPRVTSLVALFSQLNGQEVVPALFAKLAEHRTLCLWK
jgi:hypothetical protein